MKKPYLAIVEWRDIITLEDGWMSVEDAIQTGKELYNAKYRTVGWVIHEDKDFLLVAATDDISGAEYNDISMILRSVIIKVRRIP